MWDFISPINLIRYLIVWRVNGTLVQLPRYLPTALSQTLGALIAERLPAPRPREWRKALEAWASAPPTELKSSKPQILDVAWPLESVLFAYPSKRAFGQGEVILWELKLIGDSADHGIFLELILPAMEQAATTTDARWFYHNGLWGRFDIQAVYASRGARWEPVVSDGKLDLNYRVTPNQWADGLTFGADAESRLSKLTWITPCDFRSQISDFGLGSDNSKSEIQNPKSSAPTLRDILDALMERMALFLPGKQRAAAEVWAALPAEEQTQLPRALEQAQSAARHRQQLAAPPREWPGRWIGTQVFDDVPPMLIPYLELASILHVGRQTHWGCGTFRLF
jgi:hypothetical protein